MNFSYPTYAPINDHGDKKPTQDCTPAELHTAEMLTRKLAAQWAEDEGRAHLLRDAADFHKLCRLLLSRKCTFDRNGCLCRCGHDHKPAILWDDGPAHGARH